VLHEGPLLNRFKMFEAASIEKRTEDFYSNMIAGYTILDNPLRVGELQKECKQRYPRGPHCPAGRLDSARKESSPARAAQIYAEYIKDYRENIIGSSLLLVIALT